MYMDNLEQETSQGYRELASRERCIEFSLLTEVFELDVN